LEAQAICKNANQIGYGYETAGVKATRPAGDKLIWHFIAPNVHDFMWAADPEYIHISRKLKDSLTIHLLYKPTNAAAQEWQALLDMAERALPYIEKTFGSYPYKHVFIYSWRRWRYGISNGYINHLAPALLCMSGCIAGIYGMLATNESPLSMDG
jgi:hypothetical protein